MRKFYIIVLIYAIGLIACGNQNMSQNMPEAGEEVEENTIQKEEKVWSEEEIIEMFMANRTDSQKWEYEYIDCVVIPDKASERIGAVLFKDTEDGATEVAFFDERGYSQQCGIHAEVADEPDFTYQGDGAVTFKLETGEKIIYNCTISILVDGNKTAFEITDDLEVEDEQFIVQTSTVSGSFTVSVQDVIPDKSLNDTTPSVAVVAEFQSYPFTIFVGEEIGRQLKAGEVYVFTIEPVTVEYSKEYLESLSLSSLVWELNGLKITDFRLATEDELGLASLCLTIE